MRHILSWTLSILFHVIVVVGLMHTAQMPLLEPEKLLEVDLTEIETPEVITPMPAPPKPVAPETQPPEPEPLPAAAPLPMNKTVVLDDSPPPPPEPAPAPEPEPEPEPNVTEISPVKTLPPKTDEEPSDVKKVQVRKDFVVHRGHEARFGRSMMGDYFSYSAQEFSGQFKTHDNRTISIIDARNTKYGRFLIYDSKNKTLRRLKQFAKYVYTIGPSLHEDEPVCGSVTFLAKNDRIERFILMTDDDRIAHYPRKVHVREEEVAIPSANGEIRGGLSLPPYGEGHLGVVVVHGTDCVNPGLIQGFTRSLSMHELATLAFPPRGCDAENPTPSGQAELVEDTLAAVEYLAGRKETKGNGVGIWGNGKGVMAAIETAPRSKAAFVVCLLGDDVPLDRLPDADTLAGLHIPSLWLITGRDTARWNPLIATLEKLRDQKEKPITVIVAPLKASQEVLAAQSEQSGWVEQLVEDHGNLAISWIRNVTR